METGESFWVKQANEQSCVIRFESKQDFDNVTKNKWDFFVEDMVIIRLRVEGECTVEPQSKESLTLTLCSTIGSPISARAKQSNDRPGLTLDICFIIDSIFNYLDHIFT